MCEVLGRNLSDDVALVHQVESILGPIGPEQQGKPGYMKYAEPRRINEIANQNLTTNQKVGSSSPPGAPFSSMYLDRPPLRNHLQRKLFAP